MAAARVLAQAKINLFLRILAREASGYHQLETLYCRLSLGDIVTVRATDGARSLHCTGERLPDGGLGPTEENLAWRAAAAYAQLAGWPRGFAIEIEKHIPVGGGLGGGSADAGAVLRALNALNPSPLPRGALLATASSLGADVPFLTQDDSPLAMGWGRGERLLILPPLPERLCWLFWTGVPVSTVQAYQWLAAPAGPHVLPALLSQTDLGAWPSVAALAHNDFEEPVAARFPDIAKVLVTLRSPGASRLVGSYPIVQLSGSGSAVYVVAGEDRYDSWNVVGWRSDEPGVAILHTTTAVRVEPVVRID
jgi:4-diphosphocytidyl-2-C-methyl-D-erythritol kinase